MVRHDADGMDPDPREPALGPGEPLEDDAVEVGVGSEEEARLMAASGEEVVLAGELSS